MAILHIITESHTHPDHIKDARGCYKAGDIISVKDDSAHDGNVVRNPIAPGRVLVKITGVTRAQVEKYMQSYIDPATVGTEHPVTLRRRLHTLDISSLPAAILNAIANKRYVEVSWSQVRNFVRNKITNATGGTTP